MFRSENFKSTRSNLSVFIKIPITLESHIFLLNATETRSDKTKQSTYFFPPNKGTQKR